MKWNELTNGWYRLTKDTTFEGQIREYRDGAMYYEDGKPSSSPECSADTYSDVVFERIYSPVVFNFRKECRVADSSLWARDIWQILFKIYRDNGGALDGMKGMGDLLCDYDWLRREFDKGVSWKKYWCFWPKTGQTTVLEYADTSWYDHIYRVEYNSEKSEVTVTKVTEFETV